LFLNVSFIDGVSQSLGRRTFEIAPFSIVGREDKQGILGNELAVMLQVQVTKLQKELKDAQGAISSEHSEVVKERSMGSNLI
jgi:hypothetical protein